MSRKKVLNDVKVLDQKLENADNTEERQKIIAREIFLTRSGPLPDPEYFHRYEKVLPGSALNKIMAFSNMIKSMSFITIICDKIRAFLRLYNLNIAKI
ncbi:hypothetical protein TP70_06885 [Staphylococcus microti]|uniref:Uncharacterized protein n=1 Tax=Staphylococcus microti TaxID=569857 RepID=A0A0D6XPA3_9STAP|nr:hypothetical protein [Staphylococcus microti]KIX90639.1 hypothetical protein TP70_06885 [Staphylococcus microti]PNZ84612.1 hypothetical protein CD132_00230 [Staphylococcus microti]SUM56902.1 Uncharacterised protein [Staphylococcus microti]